MDVYKVKRKILIFYPDWQSFANVCVMKIKNLVWDMGQVLVALDPLPLVELLAPGKSKKDPLKALNESPWYDAYERGEYTEEAFLVELNKKFNLDLNFEQFKKLWNTILKESIEVSVGQLPKLKEKYGLYVLSNTSKTHWDCVKENYEWLKYFDRCFFCYVMGLRKPEKEIYLKLQEAIDSKPSEILFMDDRPENVKAAQALGWNAELFSHPVADIPRIFHKYSL